MAYRPIGPVWAHRYWLAIAGGISLAIPIHAAHAQEEGVWPSNQDAHPGEIVYSRNVPYGTATRRIAQGEAQTVRPDQSELITRTLTQGLQSLTDVEQAAVSAPLTSTVTLARNSIETGLSVLTGPSGNADFTRSENGASNVGGVISDALGALPRALSALSRVGKPE